MSTAMLAAFSWEKLSTENLLTILFGASGWFLFILEHLRHRQDSTKNALSEVLDPFIHALQKLNNAKDARKTNDRLRRAYPEKKPEVIVTFNRNVEEYGKLIAEAKEFFQQFERGIVSNRFRFPDKVFERLDAARRELSKTGEHLNDGSVDQVEVGIVSASSIVKELNKYARGFRLQAPFAFLRTRAERKYEAEQERKRGEHSLSESEMQQVVKLLNKRLLSQQANSFVIHPPKKLLDDPSIMTRDDCIEQLESSIFEVVFQDGTEAMVNLPQLMVFVYNLIFIAHESAAIIRRLSDSETGPHTINVSLRFSESEIMNPEMVQMLLSKVEFSKEASDA